jgi:glycosidase
VWLHELSAAAGRPVTLATVAATDWDAIASLGVHAVWLMGVWERSPAGLRIALDNASLVEDFRRALPDFTETDAVGSPYSIRRYVVDEHLGGPAGLAAARGALADRGLRLVLDFVPNHVAPDHPWVLEHPDHFVAGTAEDLQRDPVSFLQIAGRVVACGRDPFFPAWHDVLQLNAFADGQRQSAAATLAELADACDGVRCDMAMLVMNDVFARTWGDRVGPPPAADYWPSLIEGVKRHHPNFRFFAEAYWDMEWALQQQGFDHCYDKRLYDRLEDGGPDSIRLHLQADLEYQTRLLRFIENHDEPRAAATFAPEKARAVAVAFATLPGARLFHEGQLQGRRVRLPVFLVRRPAEPADRDLEAFYRKLLDALSAPALREGSWRLLEPTGWPDNPSFQALLAWAWEKGDERHVVAVNLSGDRAQARVPFTWPDLAGQQLRLTDAFSGERYDREGSETVEPGLYVDLPAWGFHLLAVERL